MAYNQLTLIPAYGRDYTSKSELAAAWQAGQDFYAAGFPEVRGNTGYTSIRDLDWFKQSGVTHLHFRYNKQRQVHVVKL